MKKSKNSIRENKKKCKKESLLICMSAFTRIYDDTIKKKFKQKINKEERKRKIYELENLEKYYPQG
jgi:hypothetical protein